MNRNSWGNIYIQHTQQPETASIPSISRQIPSIYSDTFRNANIPQISLAAKAALVKYLSFSGGYAINNASLFIDSRKQEEFDWQKNRNAYQRIIHLSDLEDKWDGYNAPQFSKQQIDLSLTLYSHLRSYSIDRNIDFDKIEPFVAPCSDGMILFEWSGKRFPNKQLELYVPISAEHPFEFLKTEGNSEVEGEFNLDELYPILDWLFNFDYLLING
ncbi:MULTISPECIES: hypothetical protein [Aphanizomenonaceae]|jgi:hypothetical protein|uniref:hypothetical protein n=1 Tax=Aphanizomenonaceae TaxID=1892259 RepID=UPI000487C425|nr:MULTISPECIES: hypothetical protein [Aphanizomenonaceae]MDB9449959.1 hypothetical protein [Dolichospermum circinale CS-547]